MWQPDIGDGDVARTAATAASVPTVAPAWGPRRVLLTQHANDAVAWWAPSLAWSRPDWLDNPRGPGTDPRMTWWPGVFFLQVGLDLATAGAQPPGIGHNYASLVAPAWAAVLDAPRLDGRRHRAAHQEADRLTLRAAGDRGGPRRQWKVIGPAVVLIRVPFVPAMSSGRSSSAPMTADLPGARRAKSAQASTFGPMDPAGKG